MNGHGNEELYNHSMEYLQKKKKNLKQQYFNIARTKNIEQIYAYKTQKRKAQSDSRDK